MGAYLVTLKARCDEPGCTAAPKVTLVNAFNAKCGDYCRKHGAKKLAEYQKHEAKVVRSMLIRLSPKEHVSG